MREAATARGQPAYGAGPALQAIASLIERTAGGSADVAAPVERMRGELAALERLGRIDLGRADRVRAALDHGVDAARALARRLGAEGLTPWVEAAARAAAAVDPAVPLGVQRAATQDALRALADAVLVAAQLGARGPRG